MTRRRLSFPILLALCIALPCLGGERQPLKNLSSFDKIRMVRAAYRRLAAYNQANRIMETNDPTQFDSARVMQFELSNFESGPIANILDRPWTKLVVFGGDVLSVWTRSSAEDGGESVTYAAEWDRVPYLSSIQLSETVADLLSRYAARNYDVGSYLSYTVTATFDGRSRTYPALVLFHDLYGSADNVWPDFWDGVAGMGGALNKIAAERRPATSPSGPSRLAVASDDEYYEESDYCVDNVGATKISLDHPNGGYHSISTVFRNCCQKMPDNTRHRCVLWPYIISRQELGGGATTLTGFSECQGTGNINLPAKCYLTFHVLFMDQKSSGYTDSLSKAVTCYAAVAATWRKCADPGCAVEGSVSIEAGLPQPAVGKAGFTFNVPNFGLGKFEWPETATCPASQPDPCRSTEIADSADYDGWSGGDTTIGVSPPCTGSSGGDTGGGSPNGGGGDPQEDIPVEISACASITIGTKTIQCCDTDALEIAACIIRGGDM